ncbi:MAG: hypothetical protein LLF75_09765 [Eubacteriales bacterium]|nr:hypothetical protein [Eubacteriales bacterium]
MKKAISILLCAVLLAGAIGCSGPSGASNSNAADAATGRYMEQVIDLPIPEGFSEQYVIGLAALENGVEVFTNTYADNKDGTSSARYFRYTILDDGSVKTAEEQWLNDLAVDGGNEMRVIRAKDGALYMFYSGFGENYQIQPHFIVSRDDGKTGTELTGDGISTIAIANSFGVLDDGSIAYTDYFNANLGLLDQNGSMVEQLEGETGKATPTLAASGSRIATIAPEAKAIRVYDRADGTSANYEYAIAENSSVIMAFSADGALYLCDATGIYRHTQDGTLWERIMDGGTCNLGLPSFYPGNMVIRAGSPDTIYLCDSSSVFRYWYDETAPAAASEELNIFSLKENETVQQAVVAFNRAQSEVLAIYTVAMGQDAGGTEQDYIKALNTELLAGNGPDVLILDGLPVESYVQKGVLAEIGGILDQAEVVLPNIRTASQSPDGKLYAMPTGIRVPLAYASGDPDSAFSSLSALADACEASGTEPLLSSTAFNYQMLAEVLLSYYGGDLYQNKDGAVNAFLSDIGRISKAIGADEVLCEGWEAAQGSTQEELLKVVRMQNGGPQIWANATNRASAALFLPMGSLYGGMINLAAAEQLNKTFCGINKQYEPVGIVGVNRAGKHTDAAASFLNTLFSYDVQSGNKFAEQFPVNQKAIEETLNRVDNTISSGMSIDPEITIFAEWPSEAMRAMLGSMIKELNRPLATDHTLSEMLVPLIVSYLDSSDTLETAAGKMESVISTYLSE